MFDEIAPFCEDIASILHHLRFQHVEQQIFPVLRLDHRVALRKGIVIGQEAGEVFLIILRDEAIHELPPLVASL